MARHELSTCAARNTPDPPQTRKPTAPTLTCFLQEEQEWSYFSTSNFVRGRGSRTTIHLAEPSMVSPTGKRPLENEIDTLCPAPQRVQENDESDADAAPRSRPGRKMARLLCSREGCESLAALGGLCKKHNPGCHCTHPGCNLVGANSVAHVQSAGSTITRTNLFLGRVHEKAVQECEFTDRDPYRPSQELD